MNALQRVAICCGSVLAPIAGFAVYETCRSVTLRSREFGGPTLSPPWHVGASLYFAVAVAVAIVSVTSAVVFALGQVRKPGAR